MMNFLVVVLVIETVGVLISLVPLIFGAWGVTLLVMAIIIAYNIFSLKSIGPTELGEILLFGKPIKEVSSGLVFAPLWFTQVLTESKNIIQEQYPDDPENVWKGKDSERPANKMPPIRVTHAGDDKDPDPMKRRATTEVSIIVQYRIDDFLTFLSMIGSTGKVRQQIRDSVIARVRQDLALKTPADTLANLEAINAGLKEHVEKMVANWGITVVDVRIEEVDFGETVNKNLRDVPAAELEKKARVIKAEALKTELTEEGNGKASAQKALLIAEAEGRKAFLTAEAAGLKTMAEGLGLTRENKAQVLALKVAQELAKEGTIILSGREGLSDLLAMAKILAPQQSKKGDEPAPQGESVGQEEKGS